MRLFLLVVAVLAGLAHGTAAQDEDEPWQIVITGQIEAFRHGDGAGALELSGAGFKEQFSDPDVFYSAIMGAGYEPLVHSRSHAFGQFVRTGEGIIVQLVRVVGPDQLIYEALYQLTEEPGVGWRVQSVMLQRVAGFGI